MLETQCSAARTANGRGFLTRSALASHGEFNIFKSISVSAFQLCFVNFCLVNFSVSGFSISAFAL
jgi:hypothetical protein